MYNAPVPNLALPYVSTSSPSTPSYAAPYSPGALDVMNAERVRTGQFERKGREDVRYRDQPSADRSRYSASTSSIPTFTSAYAAPLPGPFPNASLGPSLPLGGLSGLDPADAANLKRFSSTRSNSLRPVVFRPSGSFRALQDSGKLALEPQEVEGYQGRTGNPLAQTAFHLPGYTGFVRGSQHISGRTFGETSRRALTTEYKEIVCSSPIPSAPQANRKIRQEELTDTFVANMFGGKTYQIPGYTGFVPGLRSTYALRYGSSTERSLLAHSQRFPRGDNQSPQFARTARAREHYPVGSAPLPGGAQTQEPPEMYIPEHVRYLKFFPM